MASHLASIFGTEQDRVNCSFYYKIGACRHGDRCSRKHIKPQFSQTILLSNVYQNPAHRPDNQLTEQELQKDFDRFFEDFFIELCKFGNLLEVHVCDNVGDHLIGNVYARYEWEAEAQAAVDALNDRWYAGRPLYVELSPVTDFREACCRQNETGECNRGGFCNFMHLRDPTAGLQTALQDAQRVQRRIEPTGPMAAQPKEEAAQRSSSSRKRDDGYDRGDYERDRDREKPRERDREKDRDRERDREKRYRDRSRSPSKRERRRERSREDRDRDRR